MKAAHKMLVKAVERAINEADPIGLLDLGAPSDEPTKRRLARAGALYPAG
jgi:hypothetical protein